MSTETYKTIDKLVRKWSYLFNLDDHHAGKLRKSLENRADCLERKYDPNQCGNHEGYIASCLAKFAGCDASRAKDQQSARGEVSLDEPVNSEDAERGDHAHGDEGRRDGRTEHPDQAGRRGVSQGARVRKTAPSPFFRFRTADDQSFFGR